MTSTADSPETEWVAASTHRTPGISIQPLLQRDGEGRSFEFNLVRFGGEDFWSPRHHHNFDQIRIALEGETNYGPHRKLRARSVGYYPEATWYGPLSVNEGTSLQAILQFDGASRCGYIPYDELDKATDKLREEGEFRKGYWHPHDGGKPVDGYQASWERATGQKMVYPEQRFDEAVYLAWDAFAWQPVPDSGVKHKHLGTFGEKMLRIEMLQVPAGDTHAYGDDNERNVLFVVDGGVEVNDAAVPQHRAAIAEEGQQLDITGVGAVSELILITLPQFG